MPEIAKEGYVSIVIFAIICLVCFAISVPLGMLALALLVWCVAFFRDPHRYTPQDDNLIVAPADGKVIICEVVTPPKELGFEDDMLKISIFMNVFNVHVNRSPVAGNISKIIYYPGKFVNAALDKASEANERQAFIVNANVGKQIAFVQIAGLVARRIVKFINEDTNVKVGEKVGLIKFGSRVDVYLPKETVPLVANGQTTIAGETVLAKFVATDSAYNYQVLGRAKN